MTNFEKRIFRLYMKQRECSFFVKNNIHLSQQFSSSVVLYNVNETYFLNGNLNNKITLESQAKRRPLSQLPDLIQQSPTSRLFNLTQISFFYFCQFILFFVMIVRKTFLHTAFFHFYSIFLLFLFQWNLESTTTDIKLIIQPVPLYLYTLLKTKITFHNIQKQLSENLKHNC